MHTEWFEQDIPVMIVPASSFPDGVKAAHEKLHQAFPYDKKRRYFGISWGGENDQIIYKAAISMESTDEPRRFGFDTFVIRKGKYASKQLSDWKKDTHLIGAAFRDMLKDPRLDPDGYCLEEYGYGQEMTCRIKLRDDSD